MYKHRQLLSIPNPFQRNKNAVWPRNPKTLLRICLTTNGTFDKRFRKYDRPRFGLNFYFGNGAGYINGFTAFIAVNLRSRDYDYGNTEKLIQVGLTKNANAVPYMHD